MISIWQHVLVVLALLAANAFTFLIAKRRIEELRAALVAKKVLLGEQSRPLSKATLAVGDVLHLVAASGQTLFEVEVSNLVTLEVRTFI